jgi:hypothetical protein
VGHQCPVISRDVLFEKVKLSTEICELEDKNDNEIQRNTPSIKEDDSANVEFENDNDEMLDGDVLGTSSEDVAESMEPSVDNSAGVRRSTRIRMPLGNGGQIQLSSLRTQSRKRSVRQSLVTMLHIGNLQCPRNTSRS